MLQTSPPLPRSEGRIGLAFSRRGPVTALAHLEQVGNARVRFPGKRDGTAPEAVLVNTAGGLTGGDTLELAVQLGPDAAAVVTTIAAEKIYRSLGPSTRITSRIELAAGARLDWLPQATIVFEAARLERATEVTMAADAHFLAVEIIVLGRAAMGERLARGLLRDSWSIQRGGRLVWADRLRLDEPYGDVLGNAATLAGAGAIATVVHVAPEAPKRLDAARAVMEGAASDHGLSAWDGMLTARFAAREGHTVIADVSRLVSHLRCGDMPRVWQF